VASKRGMVASSLRRKERALDLEFAALAGPVNLETLRAEYGDLLTRYQQLATAITTLEERPSEQLIARVIRAADRWRSLEDDVTQVCQLTAEVFDTLGADELAWDYLTTPLAHKPNEGQPWANLAQTLQSQGNLDLADRAYTAAAEADGSNAQILWDHAQLLQKRGRYDRARQLYHRIAEENWQPRYNGLKQQARQKLGLSQ